MDYALIGSYYSEKLVVTSFNIQRSNDKQVITTSRRKIVGKSKQTMTITMSGYLFCTSFEDLNLEVDKLQEALNESEFKLVLSDKPHIYYTVSWNSSDLARTPNNGGYVLPFSLDFECLEEAGIEGIPCELGWVNSLIPVTHAGEYAVPTMSTSRVGTLLTEMNLATGTQDVFNLQSHSIKINNQATTSTVEVYVNSSLKTSIQLPRFNTVSVAVVYGASTTLYINGNPYVLNGYRLTPETYTLASNMQTYKIWECALTSLVPKAYINYILKADTPVIKTASLTGSTSLRYVGTAQAKASVLLKPNTTTISFNNFGVTVNDSSLQVVTCNSITSDVVASVSTLLEKVAYATGAKTLYPYLVPNTNSITKIGTGDAVIAWHNRYY